MKRQPLNDLEAASKVELLKYVPAGMPEPAAQALQKIFAAAPSVAVKASFVLALWPDGTWAVLGHNPDWPRPGPEQLVRAYRTAHTAGIWTPNFVTGRRGRLGVDAPPCKDKDLQHG